MDIKHDKPSFAPNTNTEAQKIMQRSAEADRLRDEPMPQEPAADAPRNSTRESLELTLEGQYLTAGQSPKDAKLAAKKRALEMIPADTK